MKVVTLVGTRPEIIKLSMVIPKLDKFFDHKLVHTGQNYDYELNSIFFDEMGVRKPDEFLECAGASAAETISKVIFNFDQSLEKYKPDAVVIYGDTNSCLGAIAAKRRKIPIFHLEAGNRCFDLRVPEEINRKIVDHLSDINFVHSEHARRYLLNEGVAPEQIFKSGSPMVEILNHYEKQIKGSQVLKNLSIKPNEYFVVSIHREENVDSPENFKSLLDTLVELEGRYNKKVIISTHPRTRKKLDSYSGDTGKLEFLKPLGFFDYNHLQLNAFCVLSDSGTLTEESNILGFPGVMIRQAHERPEGMDTGVAIMSGVGKDEILRSIDMITGLRKNERIIEDYSNDRVSDQVLKIIQSYTGYVNRVSWKKNL